MAEDNPEQGKRVVEYARKSRQMHLLQKVRQGKTLSTGEIKELEQLETGEVPPGCARTQEEIAKVFKVTVRTVQYWSRNGMPKPENGYYNLIDIQAWRETRAEKKSGTAASKEKKGTDWDEEFRKHRSRLYELEYQKKAGELVSRVETERERIEKIDVVKRALLALPKVCANALEGLSAAEIEVVLRDRVYEILRQFSGQVHEGAS